MNNVKTFFLCIIFSCFICSESNAQQSRPETIIIDAVKPANLVLAEDSAFFIKDVKIVKKRKKMSDTSDGPPIEGVPFSQPPTFLKMFIPTCPQEAKDSSISGLTKVRMWVDKRGNPRLAIIMESSNKIFNESSLIAAMQWTFKPALNKDKPISTWVYIPFRFKDCK